MKKSDADLRDIYRQNCNYIEFLFTFFFNQLNAKGFITLVLDNNALILMIFIL